MKLAKPKTAKTIAREKKLKTFKAEVGKRPPWRPSSYDPVYCHKIIEWGKLGKTKLWMSAEIGVQRHTLDAWASTYEDFREALDMALLYAQRKMEEDGYEGMMNKSIDASLWKLFAVNRFPADWKDRSEQVIDNRHSGNIDANVKLEPSEAYMTMLKR